MNKLQKIQRTILIALGFALATYLIMSGTAMLKQKDLKVHTNTVK